MCLRLPSPQSGVPEGSLTVVGVGVGWGRRASTPTTPITGIIAPQSPSGYLGGLWAFLGVPLLPPGPGIAWDRVRGWGGRTPGALCLVVRRPQLQPPHPCLRAF